MRPSEGVATISAANLPVLASNLQKAHLRNQSARRQHANSPQSFMNSEIHLHTAIRALSDLPALPALYEPFCQTAAPRTIGSLCMHPNVDIVTTTLQLVTELTDLTAGEEEDVSSYHVLYTTLLETGVYKRLLSTLRAYITRLHRQASSSMDDDALQTCIEDILQVFQSTFEVVGQSALAISIVEKTDLIAACLDCVDRDQRPMTRAGAAELLSTVLLLSPDAQTTFMSQNGLVVTLESLQHPKQSETGLSLEVQQNLCAVICTTLLSGRSAKQAFLEANGTDIMLDIIKISAALRTSAIKVLDFASTGFQPIANRITANGLGVVFSFLMSIGSRSRIGKRKRGRESEEDVKSMTEHVFGVLFSIIQYVDGDERKRVLFKFWENEGEKMRRVVVMYRQFAHKVQTVTGIVGKYLKSEEKNEGGDDDSHVTYLDRLDAGLFIVQMGAAIISYVVVHGAKEQRVALLRALPTLDIDVEVLAGTLVEYAENIGDEDEQGRRIEQSEEGAEKERMLTLIESVKKSAVDSSL